MVLRLVLRSSAIQSMAKKQSFFEKLTGVSKSDEEEIELFPKETEEPISKEENKMKKEKESTKPIEKEEKEWLPESEGQLTIDVYQTPNDIVIKSTIAGINPEDLDISISNDMVTIKGKREKDEEVKSEDYYYQECYWGAFSRSVILPVDIEADKAEATMKNGILTIRLPKIEKVKTRKIKVKTE